MWQDFLNDYFRFSKKERTGIIILVSAILGIILVSFLFPYFIKQPKTDPSDFEKAIAQLEADSTDKTLYSKSDRKNYADNYDLQKKDAPSKGELFFFDPNTASIEEWIKLGVREKTANTIRNYISKGGKFKKPDDLKKIYGLGSADAERLIPYVSIQEVSNKYVDADEKKFTEKKIFTPKAIEKIEINNADTSQLISLPGIGSKLANRIIAFRNKLGGFYSIEQVGETYLLPDSTFNKIKPFLVLNDNNLNKININTATIDQMKSHPYLRYNIANAIFQYRQQHGNYHSVEEIKNIMLITEDSYKKIFPYLTVN